MSELTPNLGLFKYNPLTDGKEVFSIEQALNNNWDILDENVGNIDDKITNCITEVPQDIKLELNNGTLTLKAGSRVYVPNGKDDNDNNVFDIITLTNDMTTSTPNGEINFVRYENGELYADWKVSTYSSGSDPTGVTGWFYDTTANYIGYYNDGVRQNQVSFPLGIIEVINGNISKIDQVFNGFGYIGGCVFTLPGLKGLIPNGRNEDGTLNNIEVEAQNVSIINLSGSLNRVYCGVNEFGFAQLNGLRVYDSKENYLYDGANIWRCVELGKGVWVNGKITSFEFYHPVHLLDRKDLAEVQCVVETYVNGTSWYRVYSDGWCEQGGITPGTADSMTTVVFLKPFTTVLGVQVTRRFHSYDTQDTGSLNKTTSIYSLTTTYFVTYDSAWGSSQLFWKACGYIA